MVGTLEVTLYNQEQTQYLFVPPGSALCYDEITQSFNVVDISRRHFVRSTGRTRSKKKNLDLTKYHFDDDRNYLIFVDQQQKILGQLIYVAISQVEYRYEILGNKLILYDRLSPEEEFFRRKVINLKQ